MRTKHYHGFYLLLFIFAVSLNSCAKKDDDPDSTADDPINFTVEDYTTSITENPENGFLIGSVLENPSGFSVNLIDETPEGALSLNSETGELTVLNRLDCDYEEFTEITASFSISSGLFSGVALITINILDEDDSFMGDVILKTQEEIDTFGENHYRHITGDLIIGSRNADYNKSVVDLRPLDDIQTVGDKMRIRQNLALQNIEGFNNLKAVGNNFSIFRNESLTNIPEFNALKTVGTYFGIGNNKELQYIDGFNNFISDDQLTFYIGGNNTLIEINGFDKITSVKTLSIQFNQLLLYINGLNSLTNIDVRLELITNASLIGIDGLNNISSANNLMIFNNDQLTNFDVLREIGPTVSGVSIESSDSLTSLIGLSGITSVDQYSLEILRNSSLTSLSGLDNLASINTYLYVKDNNALTDLCALQTLLVNDGLGGVLSIIDNAYNPTEQDIINGDCSS